MRKDTWFRGALRSALLLVLLGLLLSGARPLSAQFKDSVDVVDKDPGSPPGGNQGKRPGEGTSSPGDEGGIEPDVPTEGISLKDISAAIEDAFCAAAVAVGITGAFLYLEGEGMVLLGRHAPPACGQLACALNPAHCSQCRNHWQRVSDLAGGAALKTIGGALGAAGGAGIILCDD